MPSEDTIVFLAVDSNFTSMDAVVKALENFFKLKSSLDPSDRFNLIFFTEKGPMYVEDFTFKWDLLVQLLKDYHEGIVNPSFENGLFLALTFILDIYKLVSGKYFRILVIKDGSVPEITKDFLVNDLIDKVKPMPVFLDVLVLGMYDDPDQEKIKNMIAASQGGDLLSATTFEEFTKMLEQAATNKKEIKVGLWDKKPDYKMDPEHKEFFEKLSASLVPVEEVRSDSKCTVCFKPTSPIGGTDALVQCPACKTAFHDTCLVSWANQSNIGIDNVFRCPICFYLINLPEFLVDEINNGTSESFESFLQEIDQIEVLKAKDAEKSELNVILKELEF
ncbi:MAG TPA: hypothetical protein VKM55_18495 [Candidatus Lokiarchaeia archaeon]|nr:hypothetical protein [Candidatus Lokiarchaeia archaeon]